MLDYPFSEGIPSSSTAAPFSLPSVLLAMAFHSLSCSPAAYAERRLTIWAQHASKGFFLLLPKRRSFICTSILDGHRSAVRELMG